MLRGLEEIPECHQERCKLWDWKKSGRTLLDSRDSSNLLLDEAKVNSGLEKGIEIRFRIHDRPCPETSVWFPCISGFQHKDFFPFASQSIKTWRWWDRFWRRRHSSSTEKIESDRSGKILGATVIYRKYNSSGAPWRHIRWLINWAGACLRMCWRRVRETSQVLDRILKYSVRSNTAKTSEVEVGSERRQNVVCFLRWSDECCIFPDRRGSCYRFYHRMGTTCACTYSDPFGCL